MRLQVINKEWNSPMTATSLLVAFDITLVGIDRSKGGSSLTPAALVAAIVFFSLAVSFALVSNFVMLAMVGEVNRKLPDDKQISYFWWYASKVSQVLKEYRRLYPAGHLSKYYRVSLALTFTSMLGFAWQIGLFR